MQKGRVEVANLGAANFPVGSVVYQRGYFPAGSVDDVPNSDTTKVAFASIR